ncbi:hypothetical protein BDR06DRAFT_1005285 [Suillus hirtellus]|nr:hypothetical protein BDR06DRAFT_1005285 [Suillus hirtellus]
MTIPPEQANHALNITLAALQLLMKHCIKYMDLKIYGENTTSFSLQLLSFAAVVRENLKGSTFKSVPDWTSVTDDNPHIKSHPHFDKTVDYLPPS